jgi:hypothetical protein
MKCGLLLGRAADLEGPMQRMQASRSSGGQPKAASGLGYNQQVSITVFNVTEESNEADLLRLGKKAS